MPDYIKRLLQIPSVMSPGIWRYSSLLQCCRSLNSRSIFTFQKQIFTINKILQLDLTDLDCMSVIFSSLCQITDHLDQIKHDLSWETIICSQFSLFWCCTLSSVNPESFTARPWATLVIGFLHQSSWMSSVFPMASLGPHRVSCCSLSRSWMNRTFFLFQCPGSPWHSIPTMSGTLYTFS